MAIRFTDQDLSNALKLSRRSVASAPRHRAAIIIADRAEFVAAIDSALDAFATARYQESLQTTASAELERLRTIEAAARTLLATTNPDVDEVSDTAWRTIGNETRRHPARIEQLFGRLPVTLHALKKIRSAVGLLSTLSSGAAAKVASRVMKGKARHSPDAPKNALLDALAGAWLEHVEDVPHGAARNPATGGGEYVAFVLEVFRLHTAKFPPKLHRLDEQIRNELSKVRAPAIRARFKRSGVASLRSFLRGSPRKKRRTSAETSGSDHRLRRA